jgi:hypothetical protein
MDDVEGSDNKSSTILGVVFIISVEAGGRL